MKTKTPTEAIELDLITIKTLADSITILNKYLAAVDND